MLEVLKMRLKPSLKKQLLILLTRIYNSVKLIPVLVAGSLLLQCEACMQFEHGFQENYTTTVTRWVGPTTEVGVRGTLPQPSPDDTNAIWLAKNGSDASAGTQAGPKLTLAGAIAALTATKKTIHIFRNGYVGDLLFTQSSTQTLPASRNIQVEEGEIGILKNTFAGTHLELFGQNSLNGLIIYNHHMGSFVTNIILIIGSEINIDNCSIYAINPNWSSAG